MYIIVLYIYYWDGDFMTKGQHMDVPVKLLIRLILLSFIPICFGAIIYIALGISNPYNFINSIYLDSQTGKYGIESDKYLFQDAYKDILIEYPRLKTDYYDSKIDSINDFIKTEAIKLGNDYNYVYEAKDYNCLELKLNYEVKYLSDSYLSIVYKGLVTPKWANHPTHLFYTLNIDLRSAKYVRLEDMVEINDEFVKIFKRKIGNHKAEPYPEVDAYFTNIPDDQILKYLKSSDNLCRESKNYYEVFSYFTDKEICVVYPVPYAVGNHTIVKLDMDNLQ